MIITPQILPLILDPQTGDPRISYSQKLDPNIQKWFSLPAPFFLTKNETKQLKVKIAIPETADNGDHYLFFALRAQPPPEESKSVSRIETTIGANILITVSSLGTLNKTGVIEKMDFPAIIDSFDRLEGKISIKNTGSAFFKPIGKINLSSPILNGQYPILPQNILSGTTRTVKTTQDLSPQSVAPSDKTISFTGFFLGPYTMTVELKPDNTNLSLKKSTRILALPWKGLLFLTSISLAAYYFKKRRHDESK